MAGTFSIAYTQQFDAETGDFLTGGLLYVYAGGTSSPSSVYSDSALTLSQANPAELDSAGRIPAIWVADGNYRLVLRNSDGVTQFDITSTPAIGTSTSGSSSSGGTSVDTDSLLKTGYPLWLPVSGTLTGFVRMNGRTISSGSGAGSERANADVQDLFLYAWTNFSDSLCPVGGGRGATAAADYAANKVIGTLDMRGRLGYGLDDMGNSAASIVAAATAAAGALGAESVNKTILQAHLPNVTNLAVAGDGFIVRSGNVNTVQQGTGASFSAITSPVALDDASDTLTASLGGSGTALPVATLSPGRAGSWYWKL